MWLSSAFVSRFGSVTMMSNVSPLTTARISMIGAERSAVGPATDTVSDEPSRGRMSLLAPILGPLDTLIVSPSFRLRLSSMLTVRSST